MKLLALDTASELCSAALWLDGRLLERERSAPRAHAALILPMIDSLLAEVGMALGALDAIVFGRGPGAFTGVRLAAAIAQGLGFAAQRPLIPISDLRATAAQALHQTEGSQGALVCQDARMDEVYWGCFARGASSHGVSSHGDPMVAAVSAVGAEGVAPAAAVELPPTWSAQFSIVAAGTGFAAYPELLQRLQGRLALTLAQLQPRAREIAVLAAQDGMGAAVAPEEALPIYLRDRVTNTVSPASAPSSLFAPTGPVTPRSS